MVSGMPNSNIQKWRRLSTSIVLILQVVALAVHRPLAAGTEKKGAPDRAVYQVKPEDYRAAVPPQPPPRILSQTETEIRWRAEWQTEKTARDVRLKLVTIHAYATVQAEKSWNSAPKDARLLMHGQWHLDLSEIFAREWELRLREEIRMGSPVSATGANLPEAEKAIERRLLERLHEDRYMLEERHREYDKATDHGRSRSVMEQRQALHAARLKESAEKLDPPAKAP